MPPLWKLSQSSQSFPTSPAMQSDSFPASPAMGSGLPASPSLSDLGDPAWIAAYEAAGGNVRRMRAADGARPTHFVVHDARTKVGVPTPGFFQMREQVQAKVAPVLKATEEAQLMREKVETFGGQPTTSDHRAADETIPDQCVEGDAVLSHMRSNAISWAETFCPPVSKAMNAAHDAILRGDVESFAQAATSIRRALVALADYVEPPGDEKRLDHTGKLLAVGPEQFKNRLRIYLGKRLEASLQRKHAVATLDLVDEQLGAVSRLLGKAIHADGARPELDQLYITTWSVLAQVVSCAELTA